MMKKPEKDMMHEVWRLPRWIVYWAAVRLFSHATQGKYSKTEVTSLTVIEALNRWTETYKM